MEILLFIGLIAACCIAFGFTMQAYVNRNVRMILEPHDPNYYRRLWKERGFALHQPSYLNGSEKYIVQAHQFSKVPNSWLHDLYDIC